MQHVYIGLGSNLGNPAEQLQRAIAAIAQLPHTSFVSASSLYSSAPLGPADQPRFTNAVAHISTELTANELLARLQHIELEQGRVRKDERWGPRTLDLDILLFGQQHINQPHLCIPHYHMHARPFVLVPLAELCGDDFILPCGRALAQLLAHCPPDPSLARLARLELLA